MENEKVSPERIATQVGEEILESIQCRICMYILHEPKECSECNANFCNDCIETWKKKNNSCPNRCPHFELRKTHILIRNMINNLQIKCKNESQGCTEITSYESLKNHENICPYEKIICPNHINGCTYEELRKNITENHSNECGYTQINCPDCQQQFLRKDKSMHSCIKYLKEQLTKSNKQVQELSEKYEKLNLSYQKEILLMQYKFDLVEYVHEGYACDGCQDINFRGLRYHCQMCKDYDLCEICYKNIGAQHKHVFGCFGPCSIIIYSVNTEIREKIGDYTRIFAEVEASSPACPISVKLCPNLFPGKEIPQEMFTINKDTTKFSFSFQLATHYLNEKKEVEFRLFVQAKKQFIVRPLIIKFD